MLDGMRDVQLLILTALAAEPMHGHRMQSEIEALTDRLAAKHYESLEPDELDELVASSIDAE